jgi:hypothetical protein
MVNIATALHPGSVASRQDGGDPRYGCDSKRTSHRPGQRRAESRRAGQRHGSCSYLPSVAGALPSDNFEKEPP